MLRLLFLCVLLLSTTLSSAQRLVQFDTLSFIESSGVFEYATVINSTGSGSIGLKITAASSGLESYGEADWGIKGSSLQTGIIGESRAGAPLFGNFFPVIAGVRGIAHSSDGLGVYGENTAVQGSPVGVGGFVQAEDGVAISGLNFGFSGPSIAVKGVSHSPNARAIFGEADFASGSGRGVQGTSNADMGVGVYGESTSATGANVGVKGTSISPSGYGVHALNTEGVGLLARSTEDAGLISSSTNGMGAEIESHNNYGVFAFSNGAASIYGESENEIGGFIMGSPQHDDLVLGGPIGKLGSDTDDVKSELLFTSQSNATIKLDEADTHDAVYMVLNGDNERIFILEENGDLSISGTLKEGATFQRNKRSQRIDEAMAAVNAQQSLLEKQRLEIDQLNKKVEQLTELVLQMTEPKVGSE